jgi:hypothetical protein
MSSGEIILYTTEDGKTNIQLHSKDGSVWLTQAEIAELFQTTPQNITLHIKSIYSENELISESTCKEYLQVRTEGQRQIERELKHYNLDVILAVGYRVQSPRGTAFRQWATTSLKEYLVKGFVMDDARLKDPSGWDYFDELLQRIKEIRASEKRFYQKVKDIYALSVDYQSNAKETQLFFQTVQNKMLWSVTRKTAAELLVERANSTLPNMGLTSWKGSRVRKGDVSIAKNYLTHDEISELDRIVTMFIDFAEDQTKMKKTFYMKDWEERVNSFLKFHERQVLNHAGEVAHEKAEEIVLVRYEQFDLNRREQEFVEAEIEAIEELERIEREYSE